MFDVVWSYIELVPELTINTPDIEVFCLTYRPQPIQCTAEIRVLKENRDVLL